MENKKKKRKFRKRNILPLICLILYIVFLVLFFKLGVIPLNIIVSIVLVIFTVMLMGGFILINSRKKVVSILGTVLLSLFLIINAVGIYYLYHTNSFLDKSFKNDGITTKSTYYVVASKSSGLEKKDIKGDIYYYRSNSNFDKANDKLEKKYKDIYFKKSEDSTTMFNNVLENKVNFMFVEKKFYSVMFETDKTLKKEDYVILDKITIKTKIKSKSRKTNSFNLYLWGTDFTDVYMDFNMIVSVNMDTNKIMLTSIPRDYYIPVAGREDRQRDKLSFMGPYGAETVIKSVEEYFNTDLDYYLYFNAKNVPTVIDTLGGVEYCSDIDYRSLMIKPTKNGSYGSMGKYVYIKKGCQTLNGLETISAVRERTKFTGGDSARQDHIRQVVVGLMKKVKDPSVVTNYSNILDSIGGLYETTLPREVINEFAKTTVNNGGNWEIIQQSVNGQDGHDKVHVTDTTD